MQFVSAELSQKEVYRLMVGSIVPRPIAWVTTLSPQRLVNAAPFSAFSWVSDVPPIVVISVARRDGILKDTARHIEHRQEFVVNIGNESLVEKLHRTANDFPETVSEVDEAGLEVASSVDITTPRIAAAPISFECKLVQAFDFGKLKSRLIAGEVVRFHVRDDLLHDGRIDVEKLRPLARLGGPQYAKLGETIVMPPHIRSINFSLNA